MKAQINVRVRERRCVLLIAVFVLSAPLLAAQTRYPRIESLDNSDVLYRQIQSDISEYHRARTTGRELPSLSIFRYRLEDNDTFLRVASRLALPHATLASLNGFTRARFPSDTEEILIPNQPGVFAPTDPANDLEYMVSGRIPPEDLEGIDVSEHDLSTEWETPADPNVSEERTVDSEGLNTMIHTPTGPRRFYFFPGDDFTPTERRAFLGVLFRSPLAEFRVSSPFGSRANPFTGRPSFHTGIDLASAPGVPVRAVREGAVAATGEDRIYGNYVIVEHDQVFSTFYGHLSEIRVESGTEVNGGTVIGTVGSSGLTTGPHLHFEVRVRGEARNPADFIPIP